MNENENERQQTHIGSTNLNFGEIPMWPVAFAHERSFIQSICIRATHAFGLPKQTTNVKPSILLQNGYDGLR